MTRAATRFLLDTNIASYMLRGANEALRRRLARVAPAQLSVSTVTEAELRYGVARRADAPGLAAAVEEFLARVDVLPWDRSAADHYGRLRARLERSGRPLGSMDLMIAAHALALGARLVSNDRAFSQVDGLKVEDWTR